MLAAPVRRLFWVSFLTLFLEVFLIRWVPGQLRIVAYYTNFILLAAFFGLGLGLTGATRESGPSVWLARFGGVMLVVLTGKWIHLAGTIQDVPLYAVWREFDKSVVLPVWIHLPILFVLHAVLFVDLGRWTAARFNALPPLRAYAVNLVGGLCGLAAFTGLTHWGVQPYVWLAVALAALFGAHSPLRPPVRRVALGLSVALMALVAFNDRGDLWSPYYKLRTTALRYTEGLDAGLHPGYLADRPGLKAFPTEEGINIEVNDDYITYVLGMDDGMLARYPFLSTIRKQYQQPFRYAGAVDDVLVLGSGGGTDLAEAIRLGARSITAVEIDPFIVRLGHDRHPENPYGQPNVRPILDDARHFLNGEPEHLYDLILFSYLDSHRLVGAHANVRLESFLYTANAFRAAVRHLKPDGLLVVRHVLGGEAMPFIGTKFTQMLEEAVGSGKVLYRNGDYLAAPNPTVIERLRAQWDFSPPPRLLGVDTPVDDWPFLYMRARGLPGDYAAVLAGLAVVVAGAFLRRGRRPSSGIATRRAAFFAAMGAAFLLLETRSVTAWALLFGSTWRINALVFGAILVLAFLANLAVAYAGRWVCRSWVVVPGLLIALTAGAVVNSATFSGADCMVRLAAAVGLGLSPVFFAGLLFSREITREVDPGAALGWNLIGAMAGGLLEYASLTLGLRALGWIVLTLYALAVVLIPINRLEASPPAQSTG